MRRQMTAEDLLERYAAGGRDFQKADLSEADLVQANLNGANLARADLVRADLREANLLDANLFGASLIGANLVRANLLGANLVKANLWGANLVEANLFGANLVGAHLKKANLGKATVGWTAFAAIDLSKTKGLDTVRHVGPSSVGVDTVYMSRGEVPRSFLEGCGVPDGFIDYMPSLVGKLPKFYSCFISYSHKDEEFAKRLHARMTQEGLRVWFAPEEMKGGAKLREQIDKAIGLYDKLLLVLSPASMESEWVTTEVYRARQRELKEERRLLFPISLVPFEAIRRWEYFDTDTGKDLAREVREYFIRDFSSWKHHDSFEKEFSLLLRDLRKEQGPNS